MRTLATLALLCLLPVTSLAVEKVVIDGSTGVTPLVAALAKAYQAKHPAAIVEIGPGMGTKARIQALQEGKIDIAMASHGIDAAELERQGMVVHEIAKVAVVMGVNASVSVHSLDEDQICAIYSGRLANWKDAAGADLAISPLTRPDSEVDTEVVRGKIPCLSNLKMHESVKVMAKSGDMARALAATAGTVGMTTMTVVEQSGGQVKALALRGIAPDAANVDSKRYALTRDSFLVVKAPASPATRMFVDYVRSPSGAAIIAANGAIPVK